jgi:hypothetical protein
MIAARSYSGGQPLWREAGAGRGKRTELTEADLGQP